MALGAFGIPPWMLKTKDFGVLDAICFGKLSTARSSFEFIARGEAFGVDDLPLVCKPEQLLVGHIRVDRVFARMG